MIDFNNLNSSMLERLNPKELAEAFLKACLILKDCKIEIFYIDENDKHKESLIRTQNTLC
jgi:hypothetical protein